MKESQPRKEYYIERGFSRLAGPYDPAIKSHAGMLRRVLKDMRDGGIVHREVLDERGRTMVERTNMILPKR